MHSDGQKAALDGVLSRIGWVTGVIENVRTGNLIDGHARIGQALKKGKSESIPYTQVDLSEEEEKQILLLLDPIGAMATADEDLIRQLMNAVNLDSDSLAEILGSFTEIVPHFEPTSIEDQGKLDEFNLIKCPNCNHEFAR